MDQIIEHKDKVAIDSGWHDDWNKPEQYRILYIGKANADDWRDLIGSSVTWSGNTGTVRRYDRTYYLRVDDAREWTKFIETRPVKKPRRGKNYDWEWERGAWRKTWR